MMFSLQGTALRGIFSNGWDALSQGVGHFVPMGGTLRPRVWDTSSRYLKTGRGSGGQETHPVLIVVLARIRYSLFLPPDSCLRERGRVRGPWRSVDRWLSLLTDGSISPMGQRIGSRSPVAKHHRLRRKDVILSGWLPNIGR